MKITCYTDGSCPVNPGPGGWAFAIVLDEHGFDNIEASGYAPAATNNTMELQAGIECMKRLLADNLDRNVVTIHSDSRYVVTGMQVWRHDWAFHDFKVSMPNARGVREPIKNAELWKSAHAEASKLKQVRFKWMRGHVGHYWNERCDHMAGAAVKHGNRNNGEL